MPERLESGDLEQDESSIRLIAGGQEHGPTIADDVLDLEGTAPSVSPSPDVDSLKCWLFRDGEPPHSVTLDRLKELVSVRANFVWVDLSDYAEDELRRIAELLELHPESVNAAVAQWQRPRLDVHKDNFFVTVTIAQLDPKALRIEAHQLDMFVGNNFLTSAHKVPLPFQDRVMTRARQSPELMRYDSAFMLYIMLDELLEHYEIQHETLQDDIERMEERALTDTSDVFLRDLLQLKRYAFALSQLVEQHRNIFEAFLRPDFPYVGGEEVSPLFRDLNERLGRIIGTLRGARDAVNGAFDIYVSNVAHRTNQVIKILTIVSTVLLPVSVIVAFFGTSFTGIPVLRSSTGFAIMLLAIASSVVITVGVYWRQGWL